MAQQMLEWTASTQYDTGTVSCLELDDQGNCLETHVGGGRLYYRVGTINDDDKSINFGTSTRYANGTTTNIALANDGNFVEVHVSSGRLYSRVAKANFSNKTIEWRDGTAYDQYDSGYYCSVAVDQQDNCLEIHTGRYGLYYRIGQVNYTSKNINWIRGGTIFSRGSYAQCSVALDNQGNCLETHVDSNNYLYCRVGKLNGDTVTWGESSQYDRGSLTSIALDEAGNCIETHVNNNRLYYRCGKLNSGSLTIDWGESIQYSDKDNERFSFTSVACNSQGHCLQTHVIAGSPNRLYYQSTALAFKQEWKQQFGSSADDTANGIAVTPAGNIYATGTTLGQLGANSYGKADAWVAKFNAEGTQEWSKQLGTEAWDSSKGITTDSQGYIYITGYTCGSMVGQATQKTDDYHRGGADAWVIKLDSQGNEVWKRQLGSSEHDVSNAVAVDGQGYVYIAGYTLGQLIKNKQKTAQSSAWFAKLDPQGQTLWIQELGVWGWTGASDIALGSDGSIHITGSTNSNLLVQSDAWIAKYDADGNQTWLKHLCKEGESASNAVAVDSQDNIYVTGYLKANSGELISGWADVWVAKYDPNGNQQWFKSFGGVSEVDDAAHGIALDSQDNIYVTGHTESNLGSTNFGGNDAWVAKLNQNGDLLWTKQIGTPANDYAFAIAVSDEQDIYITGKTAGDLGGTNTGNYDVWLARVNS
ncbi:MAG: SBBP repeat-containing protein [Calothrix sp. MO_192.B10]|nr:SBBP repeat-containing protein [Calothrix sp. MO_192.B10]